MNCVLRCSHGIDKLDILRFGIPDQPRLAAPLPVALEPLTYLVSSHNFYPKVVSLALRQTMTLQEASQLSLEEALIESLCRQLSSVLLVDRDDWTDRVLEDDLATGIVIDRVLSAKV